MEASWRDLPVRDGSTTRNLGEGYSGGVSMPDKEDGARFQAEPRCQNPSGLVAITTATAAAAVFPTTAAATAATAAFFARFGNVDGQGAAAQILAIHRFDGLLRFLGGAHGDEAKPAGTAGFPVHHQVGFSDRAMRAKRSVQVVFSGIEGKISHKQFITHVMFYCPTNRYFLQTVPERRV